MNPRLMPKPPIPLTETLAPALLRAGLETLPVVIRKRGERASRRFIEPPTFAAPTPRRAYYHALVT
jgi:hypothetical protein